MHHLLKSLKNRNTMKKFTFSFFLITLAFSAFATTWTVTNVGTSFSPSTLTIMEGDTVVFDLDNDHNSAEVSQATWNANGSTPLAGGWVTAFGGGVVLPADLTEGTHWYVCQPHASMGMKGMIIVLGTTSIEDNPFFAGVSIYPNPSKGNIYLKGQTGHSKNLQVDIYNVQGVRVYGTTKLNNTSMEEIEIPTLEEGIYIVRLQSDEGMSMRKVIVQ
jgi:plastocyanin